MSQNQTFLDCRGLSAPLTVLRIKQAMIGRRADVSLPLDVLIDQTFRDDAQFASSITGQGSDIRLLHVVETPAQKRPAGTPAASGRRTHA